MSSKTNLAFLNAYIELDSICSEKFGTARGGVTEYINRLISHRNIPDRNEILPVLVRYRNIRNRMAHETDALSHIKDVSSSDVRWVKGFVKEVTKSKDPLSTYYRKIDKQEKWTKIRMILIPSLIAVAAIVVVVILKVLKII